MSKLLTKEVIGAIDKLQNVSNEIKSFVAEKEEVLELIKLALVSQRNVFFLGGTGQGKTYTIKNFVKRISGSIFFNQLMHEMTDKTEIFGQVSIPELQKGREVYLKKNKLLDADVINLDELFKSSREILNTLLQALNFEDITLGEEIITPKHICIFAASNEIPDFKRKKEDEILYPLYDRLHLKMITQDIKEKENGKIAMRAKRARIDNKIKNTISLEELKLLCEKAWEVEVPENIDDIVWDICDKVSKDLNRQISSRKRIEYSIICQANALLNKRATVTTEDLTVLKYYLWDYPEEIEKIEKIIKEYSESPLQEQIKSIWATAKEVIDEAIENVEKLKLREKHKAFNKAENELFLLHSTLSQLKVEAKLNKDKELIDEALNEFQRLYDNLTKNFNFTPMPINEAKERRGMI